VWLPLGLPIKLHRYEFLLNFRRGKPWDKKESIRILGDLDLSLDRPPDPLLVPLPNQNPGSAPGCMLVYTEVKLRATEVTW